MADLVITAVDDAVVERLSGQAARAERTLESLLRDLVTRAARLDDEAFERATRRIGDKLRGAGLDPTQMIRDDRDR